MNIKPAHTLCLGLIAVVFFSSCAFNRTGIKPQSTKVLIDSVLKAYGGKKKLAEIAGYRVKGKVYALLSNKKASTTRTFSRPDRLRVVINYPGTSEIRILDGEKGWRSDKHENLYSVKDFQLGSMVLQASRANIPWILEEMQDQAKLIAPAKQGEKELTGLEFTIGNGMSLRIYIDPETSLVAQSRSFLNTTKMKTYFKTVYSDYREVDGIPFPFKEENFASGFRTGITLIKEVIFNPELDDNEFRPSSESNSPIDTAFPAHL